MDREPHPLQRRGNMESVDEFESQDIIEHGCDWVERPRGQTLQGLEETVGIEFRSLHEALEVEGHESQEETTRRLVDTDDGHNQAPPKDRLEILVDLLLKNANRGIEVGGGRFTPIKPRTYSGERKSLALNRWVHEVEHFVLQSGIPQNQWTISATNFLIGMTLN